MAKIQVMAYFQLLQRMLAFVHGFFAFALFMTHCEKTLQPHLTKLSKIVIFTAKVILDSQYGT